MSTTAPPAPSRQTGDKKSLSSHFHRFVPTARLPQRADRSAAGSLPTRAFRYCEPATSASGYGYYIFPPISFSLQWDGTRHDVDLGGRRHLVPAQIRAVPRFP